MYFHRLPTRKSIHNRYEDQTTKTGRTEEGRGDGGDERRRDFGGFFQGENRRSAQFAPRSYERQKPAFHYEETALGAHAHQAGRAIFRSGLQDIRGSGIR